MNVSKSFKRHLDLFQEVPRKEISKQAKQLFKIEPTENLLMDFDFENSVVIMKNSKTQQVIILYGSKHDCEQSINFGKQLLDTFKPKTLVIEEQPLSRKLTPEETDSKGFVHPQVQ